MGTRRKKSGVGAVERLIYDIFGNVIGDTNTQVPATPAQTAAPQVNPNPPMLPQRIQPDVASTTQYLGRPLTKQRDDADLDFRRKPDNTAGVPSTPQGPIQIDLLTMSPAEVVDRIEQFVKANHLRMLEEDLYRAILQSLRHPFRPASTAVRVNNPSQTAGSNADNYYRALIGDVYAMFDSSLQQEARPLEIEVAPSMGQAYYSPSDHQINVSAYDSTSTLTHEALHAIQTSFPRVMLMTDAWSAARTRGERPFRYNDHSGLHDIFMDSVDRPYTLKRYNFVNPADGGFREVLTTAFDGMEDMHHRRDRELLMVAIKSIQDANGYYR